MANSLVYEIQLKLGDTESKIEAINKRIIELNKLISDLEAKKPNIGATDNIVSLRIELEELRKTQTALLKENILLRDTIEALNDAKKEQAKASKAASDAGKAENDTIGDTVKRIFEQASASRSLTEEYKELKKQREQLQALYVSNLNTTGQVDYGTQKLTLEQISQLVEEIWNKEKGILELMTKKNFAEEGTLKALEQEEKLLDQIVQSRNKDSDVPIPYGKDLLTLQQIEQKLADVRDAIKLKNAEAGEGDDEVEKELSAYQKLKLEINQLKDAINSAKISGEDIIKTANFEGNINEAEEHVKNLIVLENQLIGDLKVRRDVYNTINTIHGESINLIRQQRDELKRALENTPSGAEELTFNGKTKSVAEYETQLISLNGTIKAYEDRQRLLINIEKTITGSIAETKAQLKLLEAAYIDLKPAVDGTAVSIGGDYWEQLKQDISAIIPEFSSFTEAQAQSGEAAIFVKTRIDSMAASLKGSKGGFNEAKDSAVNFSKDVIDAFRKLGLGEIVEKEKQQVESELEDLRNKIIALKQRWDEAMRTGSGGADLLEKELKQLGGDFVNTTKRAEAFNVAVKETRTSAGNINFLANSFTELDKRIARTALTYFGFQQAIQFVSRQIKFDKDVTDSYADLSRILGTTKEAVIEMGEELRKLDTRTPFNELLDFAKIAARAGVAEEQISKVVGAINKLKLVSGEELGKDIDHAVTAVVKLITIFEGAGKVTEESILKTSNALVVLANASVASGEYMIAFAERLSGIQGVTKIAFDSVLGLASAFEQTGTMAEVAGTAVIQIVNKMGNDVAKYAALANGLTDPLKVTTEQIEAFRKLLNEDPGQALIKLAVGMKGSGIEFTEIAGNFENLGNRGVRITNVFENLATRAPIFLEAIRVARTGLTDFDQIISGSIAKEESFAGITERIGNQIQKAFANPTFLKTLSNISEALLFFVKVLTSIPFAAIITLITGMTTAWAIHKGNVIANTLAVSLARKEGLLYNIALLAQKLGLIGNTVATAGATVAVTGFAGATTGAAAATTVLSTALRLSPLGLILGVVGLAIPLMAAFAGNTEKAAESSRHLVEQAGRANAKLSEQRTELKKINDEFKPLIEKFEKLSTTAKEGTKEWGELLDVIRLLGNAFPTAVTGTNALNQATSISIDRINERIKAKEDEERLDAKIAIDANKRALKAAEDELAVLAKQRQDIQKTGSTSVEKKSISTLAGGDIINVTTERVKVEGDAAEKILADYVKKLDEVNALRGKVNEAIHGAAGKVKELAQWVQEYKDNMKALQDLIDTDGSPEALEKLKKKQDEIGAQILALGGNIPEETKEFKTNKEAIDFWLEKLKENTENIQLIQRNTDQGDEVIDKLERLHTKQSQIEESIKDLGGIVPGKWSPRSTRDSVNFVRDILNEIEALRQRDLERENERFGKIVELNKATLFEEQEHLKNLKEINDNADREKVTHFEASLERIDGLLLAAVAKGDKIQIQRLESERLREEKELASAKNSIQQRVVSFNEQMQALIQKEFDRLVGIGKEQLREALAEIDFEFQKFANNRFNTDLEIAVKRRDLDRQELKEVKQRYAILLGLADAFHIDRRKLQAEANKEIFNALKKTLDDQENVYQAYFRDIERLFDIEIEKIRSKFNDLRIKTFKSNASADSKKALVDFINIIEQLEVAQKEFEKSNDAFQKATFNFAFGYITEQEYLKFKAAKDKAKIEIEDLKNSLKFSFEGVNTVPDFLGVLGGKLLGLEAKDGDNPETLKRKAEDYKKFKTAVVDTFKFAGLALQNYFAMEAQLISQSTKANKDRIDLEFQQRKDRAQSIEEQQSLEREAAALKKEEDRKAFEANKKIQLEQAKINLGIQLSNLAVIASAPTPANFLSLGIAGQVAYLVQAALAFASYASNVTKIQSAQFTGARGMRIFDYGGNPDYGTTRGGFVRGRSHAQGGNPFFFKGRVFEDEIDEINVIRTKDAPKNKRYKIEGTQAQIASAANVVGRGVDFAPGWRLEELARGGRLKGEFGLNTSFLQSSGGTDARLNAGMVELSKAIVDTNMRITQQSKNLDKVAWQTNTRMDKIKVINVATETTTVSNNIKRAENIGTIGG